MDFSEYKTLVYSDLFRIKADATPSLLLKELIFGEAFKYNFWMRTCLYSLGHSILKFTLHPVARLFLRRYKYKYGISIPFRTKIQSGFCIGHFGGIVVNEHCIIGKNCNLSHGVTLGKANRGKNQGHPVIGNNVYIGPGAKIVGGVNIGSYAAVGANCVVTKDVPEHGVVVGIPGNVISDSGSDGYINRTDYE